MCLCMRVCVTEHGNSHGVLYDFMFYAYGHPFLHYCCLQHVFVTAAGASSLCSSDGFTVAAGITCQRDQLDRPIFGTLQFCSSALPTFAPSVGSPLYTALLSATLHETFHSECRIIFSCYGIQGRGWVVVEEAPVESSSKRSDTRAGSSKGMGATTPPLPGAGVRWLRLVSAHGGSLGAHVEEHATRHGLGGGDAACVGSSSMK